ncbi:MAG: arsenate reductase (glutaredoxin) [Arenimonas sp.]
MKATIYHNSKCSKSNAALTLLHEHGIWVEVIHYIETPLSNEVLHKLLEQLGMEANKLVRFGEPVAQELGITLNDNRDKDEWINLMIEHPILIERPIVVINNKAVIGRPPEILLDLIQFD